MTTETQTRSETMNATASYHISNLGAAGKGITTDQDGYVHLTAQGWYDAPMDWGSDWDGDDDDDAKMERCEEMAQEAIEATAAAEGAIDDWRTRQ